MEIEILGESADDPAQNLSGNESDDAHDDDLISDAENDENDSVSGKYCIILYLTLYCSHFIMV